jgi:hypothetical protein
LARNEITHTVLDPTYANWHNYLFGIINGCSAAAMREPVSSRIALERVQDGLDLKSELSKLGSYSEHDPKIPSIVSAFLISAAESKGVLRGAF